MRRWMTLIRVLTSSLNPETAVTMDSDSSCALSSEDLVEYNPGIFAIIMQLILHSWIFKKHLQQFNAD